MAKKSKKILVVEDNKFHQKLAKDILEMDSHQVTVLEDGKKAVETALQDKPDLVLMDIQLIEVCGIDIIKEIKQEESLADIPIIAVTAFAMKGDKNRIILESGCDDYIAKPFFRQEFIELVNKYLFPEAVA